LKECLAVVPDPQQEEYPFKEIALSRADVEWLIATLDGKPVNLSASILQKITLSNLGKQKD